MKNEALPHKKAFQACHLQKQVKTGGLFKIPDSEKAALRLSLL
jgi:hypothetical protein